MESTLDKLRDLIRRHDEIHAELEKLISPKQAKSESSQSDTPKKRKYTKRKKNRMDDGNVPLPPKAKIFRCMTCKHQFMSTLHLADASCPECNSIEIIKAPK